MTMTTIPKPSLKIVPLYQLAALLLLVFGVFFIFDRVAAGSVLVGGLIQVVPQAWFARQAFKYTGARQTDLVVRSMYRGETGKVVLTATLFAVVFALYKQWDYFALFAAFILMMPLQWALTKRILKH